ncbi:943_t:CDS:2 [Cetraspora pellucida]|uniref:943_t:CDS:1 n=1 Tax=Cetraspora pellucida TaxID=1433469 RepID=A0A9N9D1Q2_9GLOM|nr:943_t:CDS:2 [Cetraspora pellucida]
MPKCLYCKKVFINQKALVIHTNLVEITNRVLNNQNKLERQNLSVKKDMNYKQHCFKYNLNNGLEEINSNINSFIENQNPNRSIEEQIIELFNQSDSQSNDQSDSQSNDHSDFQSNNHNNSQSNNHSNSQSNISDA